MEFNPCSAEDWGSSISSFTDGYFSSQIFHSGAFGSGGMRSLPPPQSALEAMEREILKKQIREEILAKEEQRRLLEEEVRREMEMERILESRKFQVESLLSLDGSGQLLMHSRRDQLESFPAADRNAVSVRRGLVREAPEVVFSERAPSHLLQKKAVPVRQPMVPRKMEMTTGSNEITSPDLKPPGLKSKPIEKQSNLCLFTVTATNEEGLDEPLHGKRHASKEEMLRSKKKPACEPLKKHVKDKKQQRICCRLCNVKCNSQVMMESHLSGKKHKRMLELRKGNSKGEAMEEEPITSLTDGNEGSAKEESAKAAPAAAGTVTG